MVLRLKSAGYVMGRIKRAAARDREQMTEETVGAARCPSA